MSGIGILPVKFLAKSDRLEAYPTEATAPAHWLRHAGAVAVSVVWGLLWLSGKNSGEAARLWIPLMPLALWLLPGGWSRETTDRDDCVSDREWLALLVLQSVTCLLTVARVSGFHF